MTEYVRNTGFFHQVYHVAWSDIMYLKHTFWNTLIMTIMTPLLYLIAFGYGLRSGETEIGVSYIAFVIPGIMALTSMSSSFSSTSARINVQRLYYRSFDEMMMCPLSNAAIIFGKSMLGFIRGILGCFVMYALGLFLAPDLALTPLAVICVILSCVVFSMLGMAAALIAKSHASMATFNSLVILPMTFLCGTFFSAQSLPTFVQGILYIFPLTEASMCIRAGSLDLYAFPFWALGVIIAYIVAFFAIDLYLIKNRKV
jgi:ABC-type multidrug transport system permease subunit